MDIEQRILVSLSIDGNDSVSFPTQHGWSNKYSVEFEAVTPDAAISDVVAFVNDMSALPYLNLADFQEAADKVNAAISETKIYVTDVINTACLECADSQEMRLLSFVFGDALSLTVKFKYNGEVNFGSSTSNEVGNTVGFDDGEARAKDSDSVDTQGRYHWQLITESDSACILDNGDGAETYKKVSTYLGRPKSYGELVNLIQEHGVSRFKTSDRNLARRLSESNRLLTTELGLLIVTDNLHAETAITTAPDGGKVTVANSLFTLTLHCTEDAEYVLDDEEEL